VDGNTRMVEIGEIVTISYFADKHHLSGPEEQKKGMHYIHELGEETGVRPILVYDRVNKQMGVVGGEYRVEDRGIVN